MRRQPLRILQVNSYFGGGGVDGQTLDLATGLRALGDDVTLSVPEGSRWTRLARLRGLRMETFARNGALRLRRVSAWARAIRERRIHVIHAHQGADYWPAVMAARLARVGTRVVVTRHLITRPRFVTRQFILAAAHVIAVSRAVQDVLERELRGPRSRIHHIPAGIDVVRFSNGSRQAIATFRERQGWGPDNVVFGMVGGNGIFGGKGHLEFIEAAAELRTRYPNTRFAIIGVSSAQAELRRRACRAGLATGVTFLPFVDEIEDAIGALDVLVHPACGSEGLGLVVLEAMAAGKAVLATRLDGIPEAMEHGEQGMLVPPGDTHALALGMRRLLAVPALRERFGRAGPTRVRRLYSREEMAARTHDLYAAICSRRG